MEMVICVLQKERGRESKKMGENEKKKNATVQSINNMEFEINNAHVGYNGD